MGDSTTIEWTDVTRGVVQRFMAWLRRLFARPIAPAAPVNEPPVATPAAPCVEIAIEAAPPPAPAKPKRAPRRNIAGTLADILENVEEAFESVQLPVSVSATERDVRRALRRIGPWVPFRSPWEEDCNRTVVASEYRRSWPSIIFMSRGKANDAKDGRECTDGDVGVVAFAYAMKWDTTPWTVHREPGVCYEFGMAFRLRGALEWVHMIVVVNPVTGETKVCDELTAQSVRLEKGKSRGQTYTVKRWAQPMVDGASLWGDTKAARDVACRAIFVEVFEWWQRRNDRWTVSVRRGKDRVTWSIEQALTKDFFRDRETTVLTPSGQKRRIIHYVNAHTRTLRDGRETPVKEHLRGERRFAWRGFACSVIAPRFHKFTLQAFDPGVSIEEYPGEVGVPIAQYAPWLARLEDDQVPPPFRGGAQERRRTA